jgi:hypothetical protein
MPLTAYLPLEQVYAFHEAAETWVLRRYAAGTVIAAGMERVRPGYVDQPIALFHNRTGRSTGTSPGGNTAPSTCVVYTRTRLRTTEDAQAAQQAADVLTDPQTRLQWQATASGDWDEARGFAVTLTKIGAVGGPPWT